MTLSTQILKLENKTHAVTAASWLNVFGRTEYEIGIRCFAEGRFTLIQGDWNEETVLQAAAAVNSLLKYGFKPETIKRIFPS